MNRLLIIAIVLTAMIAAYVVVNNTPTGAVVRVKTSPLPDQKACKIIIEEYEVMVPYEHNLESETVTRYRTEIRTREIEICE